MPEGSGGPVKSVERALDVLETLGSANEPMGLTELIEATQLPLATVHRLLATLRARGYARQDASRKYLLGPAVLKLRDPSSHLYETWARPHLAELARVSGETANLATLDRDAVIYVSQVASSRKLRMFTEVGNRVLPHASAVGKVLLAFRPRSEAERCIERTGLPARTDRTITEPERFLKELDAVVDRGFAIDNGEEEDDVRCVAVPVLVAGEPVLAMSVSGPTARIEQAERHHLVAQMQTISTALSASLTDNGDKP